MCSYMCLSKNNNNDETVNFNKFNLKRSTKKNILGINIDQKITFTSHIKTLCTKAGQKLSPFSTI